MTDLATEHLSVVLTQHQRQAARQIKQYLRAGHMSITVGGLAGTGKTTLIRGLAKELSLSEDSVAFCAFTGKATALINRRFPQAGATTIHSLIYRAVETHCKECPARFRQDKVPEGQTAMRFCHDVDCPQCNISFVPKGELPDHTELIVVDEASMVPEILYEHLTSYGVPVVWVGDHGQLPPVKSAHNLMEDPEIVLEQTMRHLADSPILKLAMEVRESSRRAPRMGKYGKGVEVRKGGGFKSNPTEWQDGSLVVLVPTNESRVAVNEAVRRGLGKQGEPTVGDRVICLRNNAQAGIFHGLTGTIVEITGSVWGDPYYVAAIQLDDEDRLYVGRISKDQFNSKRPLMEIPRRDMDLWDYAYALTVHKAQGSEYRRVVVRADLRTVSNRTRWLYTAITRATEQLEVIYPN